MNEPMDRRTVLAGLLALATIGGTPLLAACGGSAPAGPATLPSGMHALGAGIARQQVALTQAPDLGAVVAGMDAFAAHLHASAAQTSTNFTVSPLSIAVAFGMLRAGARGSTASQLDAAFGFPRSTLPAGSPHTAFNALTAALVTTGPVSKEPAPTPSGQLAPSPIVAVANALFVEQGFGPAIDRDFLRILAGQYGAHPATVDFTKPSAVAAINAWVVAQTRGRITKLFDQLDPSTLLVLANAVYLKATWLQQFDPASTVAAPFTTPTGRQVSAPAMRLSLDSVGYDENDTYQRVTLPYVGGQLSMQVVLPRAIVRDRAALTALLPAATAVRPPGGPLGWVDLSMPRWKTATTLDLLAALAPLGLTDLGDLTGIAAGLFVSQAVHRATITVDEQGSEAAAVTGIATATSGHIGTPTPMVVDRPYVWAVLHTPTGTPLFVGHVVDPTT